MATPLATSEVEARRSPRTNLLLTASAQVEGRTLTIRIRNVSESGALLEGSGLPGAGGQILLARGDVEVVATVAWASGDRRGVEFDRAVAIAAWTAGRPRVIDCTGLRDQRRVDALQAAARNGTLRVDEAAAARAPAVPADLELRIAEELAYVQRLLEMMGDELVGDPAVVHRHCRSLQTADLAAQILSRLATILRADDRAAAIADLGMDDLRARLLRKAMAA